jgi:hypothetical protein
VNRKELDDLIAASNEARSRHCDVLSVLGAFGYTPRAAEELVTNGLFLLLHGQFAVLAELHHARQALELALTRITPDTEYLRDELDHLIRETDSLLSKIDAEERLRSDRELLP